MSESAYDTWSATDTQKDQCKLGFDFMWDTMWYNTKNAEENEILESYDTFNYTP